VALERRVARFSTIAGNLEIKVEPAGIQLAACEAPVLEIDAELGEFCH
jgi:hypothetical protein